MTLELLRQLANSGEVPLAELDQALFAAVAERRSLLAVLLERRPELRGWLELQFSTLGAPELRAFEAETESLARLPTGLCDGFLALPVGTDPKTGSVDLVCVDPTDAHLVAEFQYHLDAPVHVRRAPYGALVAALEAARGAAEFAGIEHERTPAFGTAAEHRDSTSPRERVRVTEPPRAGRSSLPAEGSAPPIPLVRRAARSDGAPTLEERSRRLSKIENRFNEIESPGSIADLLAEGLGVLGTSIVFAVRSSGFQGRSASGLEVSEERVRRLALDAHVHSIAAAAIDAGYYFGPLPHTAAHAALQTVLPAGARAELYVVPVRVAGRAALVGLVGGFEESTEATRAADRLARAAAEALKRILHQRKERGGA
ncbi:MAG TPA: hypothetical protein VF989_12890 [Polyangiaceae bacterium]